MRVRLVGATVVALLAVTLGACGDQQAGETSSGTVRQLTAANFGSSISQAQADSHTVHLDGTMTIPGAAPMTMTGDVSVGKTVDDLVMRMSIDGGPGKTADMVLLDRTLYLKVSGTGTTRDPSRPWLEIDLDDPSNPMAAMLDQMLAGVDPKRIGALYASIEKLSDLGVDRVNGVEARHYVVTVNTDKVISALGLDKLPGVTVSQIEAQMPDSITSQIWLDSQQRPVRTKSAANGTTTEFTYSGWGKPVVVKAPPASQVSPLPRTGH